MAPSSLCMLTSVSAHRASLWKSSGIALMDNDAANQLVLDRQYYSPEWRLTSAFNASLNTSLLTAFAELEEVEVDGFVFRRKRSVSVAATSQRGRESAAHQASSKRRRTSTAGALSALTEAGAAPSSMQGTQAVEPEEAAGLPDGKAANADVGMELDASPKEGPQQDQGEHQLALQPGEQLAQLCKQLCQEHLDGLSQQLQAGGLLRFAPFAFLCCQAAGCDAAARDGAEAVQAGLSCFVELVQSAAAEGSIQFAAPQLPLGDADFSDLMVGEDPATRKAALTAQLANLKEEEEGWKRVLEEHRDTALPSAEAQLPCQTGYVEPVQEEHQETALHSAEAEVPSQTGDVAAAQGGDAQEAAEGGQSAAEPAAEKPTGGDAPTTAAPVKVGLLQQARADAHRRVTMQVEGLCALVSGCEELVAKAQQHGTIIQAAYHHERFRTFPHVDSPARLIKELLKPRAGV
eukprot:jgi/Astpho2/2231/fgenesh1_pg.00040_%23_64_t